MRKLIFVIFMIPVLGVAQLQSSGPISIGDLRTEAGQFGAYRLQADGTANFAVTPNPTALSEFYGLSATGGSCVRITNVRFSTTSGTAACSASLSLGTYGADATFANNSSIFSNNTCTNTAPAGYYSDGTIWKYWNGSSFTSNGICI